MDEIAKRANCEGLSISPSLARLNLWRSGKQDPMDEIVKRANCEDAERPMWLPEHCVCPVDVPADTKDHEDDPDNQYWNRSYGC
ncbi:hypothetical protein STEG23_016703, partial [Scotinomys teguina]